MIETFMRSSLETLKDKKELLGAEVGVANGANSEAILANLDIKRLFLVDLWDFRGNKSTSPCEPVEFKQALKILGNDPRCIFLGLASARAAEFVDDLSLDFVYIDASHEYEDVKTDILSWVPKVKVGGLVAGHDIGCEGVKRAVDELNVKYETGQTDWWFTKC